MLKNLLNQLQRNKPEDKISVPIQCTTNSCLNCGIILHKIPQKKSKCKECNGIIQPKRAPYQNNKHLYTAENAEQVEALWERRDYIENLSQFNITEKVYLDKLEHLRKRFGRDPYEQDVYWGILNDLRSKYVNNEELLYLMITHLWDRESNASQLVDELYKKFIFKRSFDSGIKSIKIKSAKFTCDSCKKKIIEGEYTQIQLEDFSLVNQSCKCTCLPLNITPVFIWENNQSNT